MKQIVNLERILEEGSKKYKYNYILTKNDLSVSTGDSCAEVPAYGIMVEKENYINGELIGVDKDSIEHISPYRHKVQEMLKLLYENVVSPVHLVDVIGEKVDKCVSDFESTDVIVKEM